MTVQNSTYGVYWVHVGRNTVGYRTTKSVDTATITDGTSLRALSSVSNDEI